MAHQSSARLQGWPPLPQPLPHPVVDSHAHLDITRNDLLDQAHSDDDAPAVLAQAASLQPGDQPQGSLAAGLSAPFGPQVALALAEKVNVIGVVHSGCDVPSSRFGVQLAEQLPSVAAAVALHPNEAPPLAQAGQLDEALNEIESMLRVGPSVVALGETGLDYFRTEPPGRPAQLKSFQAHIELARQYDKTLVIHDRDAHDDVIATLLDVGAPQRVVFHCFSGDEAMATVCAQQGWYLSFAGTFTFSNAGMLRQALKKVPAQLLLVETDAPFLTPTPHRGRPNASYLIPLSVRAMAEVRGDDVEQLCAHLWHNTANAFAHTW